MHEIGVVNVTPDVKATSLLRGRDLGGGDFYVLWCIVAVSSYFGEEDEVRSPFKDLCFRRRAGKASQNSVFRALPPSGVADRDNRRIDGPATRPSVPALVAADGARPAPRPRSLPGDGHRRGTLSTCAGRRASIGTGHGMAKETSSSTTVGVSAGGTWRTGERRSG